MKILNVYMVTLQRTGVVSPVVIDAESEDEARKKASKKFPEWEVLTVEFERRSAKPISDTSGPDQESP